MSQELPLSQQPLPSSRQLQLPSSPHWFPSSRQGQPFAPPVPRVSSSVPRVFAWTFLWLHYQAMPLSSTFLSKHAPRVVQPVHANALAHTSTPFYVRTLAQTGSLRGFPLGGHTIPSFMPNHQALGFSYRIFLQVYLHSCLTIGPWVSLPRSFSLLFFTFPNFSAEIYFPHILDVAAKVCRSPGTGNRQTVTTWLPRYTNTT